MVGRISGTGSYFIMHPYNYMQGRSQVRGMQAQGMQSAGVQAVSGVSSADNVSAARGSSIPRGYLSSPEDAAAPQKLFIRQGADPAEYAVRMRMQHMEEPAASGLPGQKEEMKGIQNVQKAAEDGECQTCEQRKYQDGSDDMGVSFKTPTKIAPEAAGAAVRGHEQEHVTRERAKAEREDRRVVSQTVTLHTDICPECGKVYISGGTTQTTTAAKPEPVDISAQVQPKQQAV